MSWGGSGRRGVGFGVSKGTKKRERLQSKHVALAGNGKEKERKRVWRQKTKDEPANGTTLGLG